MAVKTTALEAAARQIRPFVGPDTVIISVLNGITSEEMLERLYPGRLLWSVALPADAPETWLREMMPAFAADAMPSMRQDVLARRPTEVEQFAGVICRLGKKHGVPTPVNDFFYARIREIEASWTRQDTAP